MGFSAILPSQELNALFEKEQRDASVNHYTIDPALSDDVSPA